MTIDEIPQRCLAAEDYASKIDRNCKELKESYNECLQYNNKVVAMNLGPKILSKSHKAV